MINDFSIYLSFPIIKDNTFFLAGPRKVRLPVPFTLLSHRGSGDQTQIGPY